jgi:cell division protein FtsB
MALTILPGKRGLISLIGLARDRAAIKAELSRLDERRTVLEKELRQLTTDQATIDRLIREELGWVRRNETVYRIPDK